MLPSGGLPDPAALGATANPLLGMGLAAGAAAGLPCHQQLMTGMQQPAGVLAMGGFAAQQPQGETRHDCCCVCSSVVFPNSRTALCWALLAGALQTCLLRRTSQRSPSQSAPCRTGFCLRSCQNTQSGYLPPAHLLSAIQTPLDLCSLLTLQPPRATLACLARQGPTRP